MLWLLVIGAWRWAGWRKRTSLTFLTWSCIINESAVFGNHGKREGKYITNSQSLSFLWWHSVLRLFKLGDLSTMVDHILQWFLGGTCLLSESLQVMVWPSGSGSIFPWSRVSGCYLVSSVSLAFNHPSSVLTCLPYIWLLKQHLSWKIFWPERGEVPSESWRLLSETVKMEYLWHFTVFDISELSLNISKSWLCSLFSLCRGIGATFIQRASPELGQGLWPVPASFAHASRALLHPLPPGLQERAGLWVDLHRMVTWPITSMCAAHLRNHHCRLT